MADAPARSGPLGVITRKVGPLPVWAYAAVLVLAYFLYRRSHPSSSSTPAGQPSSGGPTTGDQAYVPPFDAAGASGGAGIGSTGTPTVVNNYYYGTEATQQANGGGTSSGTPGSTVPGTPGIHYFGPGGTGVYYPPPGAAPVPSKHLPVVPAH